MYSKTTNKIWITVNPYFLEEQSEPDDQHFVWAYQVTINNLSKDVVKLKNRYICSLSLLQDKYPNAWKKYNDEDIIKMIVYPTINYKLKDRKVA